MELTLSLQPTGLVQVVCDDHPSHTFDVARIIPDSQRADAPPQPLDNPTAYGQALYQALFAHDTLSRQTLDALPERIVLVCPDAMLDAIPWEYLHDSSSWLATDYPLVRAIPKDKRIPVPQLTEPLHIVAVPAQPIDPSIDPLDIEGEWLRLREEIEKIDQRMTLERTRPPTLDELRTRLAGKRQRVVHFMGHGGRNDTTSTLIFEREIGNLSAEALQRLQGNSHAVSAQDFVKSVRQETFLVTLNACVSATPGNTEFSNLAAALVRQRIPYALGMRFSIFDPDARAFSRSFYLNLARGVPLEEALRQARMTLAQSERAWAIGVPVLYTCVVDATPAFPVVAGTPQITDPRPPVNLTVLPSVQGAFYGRIGELVALEWYLTGDQRQPLVTLHGFGGQGKTALAREIAERVRHAWAGGVVAISLENLPSRDQVVRDTASVLGINPATVPNQLEAIVGTQLAQRRTLIVLDNAETLTEALRQNNSQAINVAQWLQQVPRKTVSLLVTSREPLGWNDERVIELAGMDDAEGARFFAENAPQKIVEAKQAEALSQRVLGHPFSLRLLGRTFNDLPPSTSLTEFTRDCFNHLPTAEDMVQQPEHRQRSLAASIEFSTKTLDPATRAVLDDLWVFHAPFLPEIAVTTLVADPDEEHEQSIYQQLHTLFRRGLLDAVSIPHDDGYLLLYQLHPTTRSYLETKKYDSAQQQALLARFGASYAGLANRLYNHLEEGGFYPLIALLCRDDMQRSLAYSSAMRKVQHYRDWAVVMLKIGMLLEARNLLEIALDIVVDHENKAIILMNMGGLYKGIGQTGRALALFEQALRMMREVHDRKGEAATLMNMGVAYQGSRQLERALTFYEQALRMMCEVHDRKGEATTMVNMGFVYVEMGQFQCALTLLEQALPIMCEVRYRAGEAATLVNLGIAYQAMGRKEYALRFFEQALPIMREVHNRAGEATTLFSRGILLYNVFARTTEAIVSLESAIQVLKQTQLDQTANGVSIQQISNALYAMRQGKTLDNI